jgi:protein SCO1/2
MIAAAMRNGKYLALAFALWSAVAAAHGPAQHDGNSASILPVPPAEGVAALPGFGGSFSLIDHTGAPRRDADFHGKMMLVVFGYTECPDVCPMELQAIADALDMIGAASASKVTPVFITVDPRHDTPEQLAAFIRQFHPSIVGLTGSDQEIARVMIEYRVHAFIPKGASLHEISHSSFMYLMSSSGGFLSLIMPGASSEDIAARLLKYAN